LPEHGLKGVARGHLNPFSRQRSFQPLLRRTFLRRRQKRRCCLWWDPFRRGDKEADDEPSARLP